MACFEANCFFSALTGTAAKPPFSPPPTTSCWAEEEETEKIQRRRALACHADKVHRTKTKEAFMKTFQIIQL